MDIVKESFNRLISPYFFWKAFFSQESSEKDQKISEALMHWIEGGIALYGILVGTAILLFGKTAEPAKFIALVIAVVHLCLQFKCGWSAHKRYLKRKLDEKINNIHEEFYKHHNSEKEECCNDNDFEESDPIGIILERFNLPKDTKDLHMIKKRYRELAKKYHPDMENGDAALFKQIVADFEYMKYYFSQKAS